MNKSTTFAIIVALLFSTMAKAGLIDRGNGLVYDDVLDITWLIDANYAKSSGYDDNGLMSWTTAQQWANDLVYQGYDNWRLPTTTIEPATALYSCTAAQDADIDTSGCVYGWNSTNTAYELGYMFYANLANTGYFDTSRSVQAGWNVLNNTFTDALTGETKAFTNLNRGVYWSESTYREEFRNQAYYHSFSTGRQGHAPRSNEYYAWAVHDGDIAKPQVKTLSVSQAQLPAPVELPEPATWLMMLVAGLALFRKRTA